MRPFSTRRLAEVIGALRPRWRDSGTRHVKLPRESTVDIAAAPVPQIPETRLKRAGRPCFRRFRANGTTRLLQDLVLPRRWVVLLDAPSCRSRRAYGDSAGDYPKRPPFAVFSRAALESLRGRPSAIGHPCARLATLWCRIPKALSEVPVARVPVFFTTKLASKGFFPSKPQRSAAVGGPHVEGMEFLRASATQAGINFSERDTHLVRLRTEMRAPLGSARGVLARRASDLSGF